MALSSLSVVMNANRLRTFRSDAIPEARQEAQVEVRVEVPERTKEEKMGTVRDPVCGMDVDPATAAGSEEYQGQTYYFCSQGCLERFKERPESFVSASEPA
jgi:Cu+-exporting ATPase